MISELIGWIRLECNLKQRELADVLGVPLQRVKRLAAGEVKNLTREEMEALTTKLRIRPEWLLADGQGPMFMTEAEHARWLAGNAVPAALREQVKRVQDQAPAWPDPGPPRSKAEAELLANWRACSKKDRETVSELAARLAPPP